MFQNNFIGPCRIVQIVIVRLEENKSVEGGKHETRCYGKKEGLLEEILMWP